MPDIPTLYRSPSPSQIVGIGAVTGYGWGVEALFDGLSRSESAVVLHNEGLDEYVDNGTAYLSLISEDGGSPEDGPSRFMRAMRSAAREAMHDAISRGWTPGDNVGVVHAIVGLDQDLWADLYTEPLPLAKIRPRRWSNMMPRTPLSDFMAEFSLHGPSLSVGAACAAAAAAIVTAQLWLDVGLASDVVVIATDLSGNRYHLRGFVDTGAAVIKYPPFDACRPFQEGTKGFVGGEAAAGLVLTKRPGESYLQILGGAQTSDAFSPYAIAPDEVQLERCFREAITASGLTPDDITYVNAHGTGTRMGDRAESNVIDRVLPHVQGIYSTKPYTGHCQGATAAIETLAAIYAYETGVVPATPQVAPGHPHLLDGPTLRLPGPTLKSAIGMGGANVAYVLDAPDRAVIPSAATGDQILPQAA